jgi:hypothetical protein
LKCSKCGAENTSADRYCPSCGFPTGGYASPETLKGVETRLARFFSFSPRLLPFSDRLASLFEIDTVRAINPIVLFLPIAFTLLLGLMPSANGHIESTPYLFQILPIISVFNPFLGYLSSLAFAVGDLIQKLIIDDVYYGSASPTAADWIGARIGFLISYSSVLLFGVLPGVLGRLLRQYMTRRRMMGKSLDGGTATLVASMIPYVFGGAIGAAICGAAAIGLELPSFYLRQTPDLSCARSMINANMSYTIPTASASGFVGGIVGPVANSVLPTIMPPSTSAPTEALSSVPAGLTAGIGQLKGLLEKYLPAKPVATEEMTMKGQEQSPGKPYGAATLEQTSTWIKSTQEASGTVEERTEKVRKTFESVKNLLPDKIAKIAEDLLTGVDKAVNMVKDLPLSNVKSVVDFLNEYNKAAQEVQQTYNVDSTRARNMGFFDTVASRMQEYSQKGVKTITDWIESGAQELRAHGIIRDEAYTEVKDCCDMANSLPKETKELIYDKPKDMLVPKKGQKGHPYAVSNKMMDDVFGPEGGTPPPGSKWDMLREEWMLRDDKGVYRIRTGCKKPPD